MKIGRNDPCPCGSGKKYKHCCLEADNTARRVEDGGFGGMADLPPVHQLMGFSSAIEYTDAMHRYTDYCENYLPPGEPAPTFREYIFGGLDTGGIIRELGLDRVLEKTSDLDEARPLIDKAVADYNARIEEEEDSILVEKLEELAAKGPLKAKSAVTVNKQVDADRVKQAPVIAYMEAFLEFMVRNNGLISIDETGKLTADVGEVFILLEEQGHREIVARDSTGEPVFPRNLLIVKACMTELGYIELTEKGFKVTEKGLSFLAGKGRKAAYFRALTVISDKLDWFSQSGLPEEAEVFQDLLGVALLTAERLEKEGSRKIKPKVILDTVDSMFGVYEEVKAAGIDRKRAVDIFTDYFFLMYCYLFDFIRIQKLDADGRPVGFSRTPLPSELFRWEL